MATVLTTRAQVVAEMPPEIWTAAVTGTDGEEIAGLLDQLLANAALFADSAAGQLAVVCDALYRRARIETGKNPWSAAATDIRAKRADEAKSGDAGSFGGGVVAADELKFDDVGQEGL